VVLQDLSKHMDEVKRRPGEAAALVERLKHGGASEADRQRLLERLKAEEAVLAFLAAASQRPQQTTRTQPRGQRARRRQRCSTRG
jgi:hypothetical protein